MNYREIKRNLKADAQSILSIPTTEPTNGETVYDDGEGNILASLYLGSVFSLDPCGRYHHIFSPNHLSARCERYWENLERAADELGLSIDSGEGDPCDVFVVRWLRDSAGDDDGQ